MTGATPPEPAPVNQTEGKKEIEQRKGSLKQKKVESFIGHKRNVQRAIDELVEIEEITEQKKRVSFHKDVKENEEKTSIVRHKKHVEKLIEELIALDQALASNVKMGKKDEDTKKKSEGVDEHLAHQQYKEEAVDYTIAAKEKLKEVEEKLYRWVDKSTNRVYFITSLLVVIASILTAFASYIFVFLPKSIYSSHLLREIFLIEDETIKKNGFASEARFHYLAPLPAPIICMYLLVLYSVYLVLYPKQWKTVRFLEYSLFIFVEVYIVLCALAYAVDGSQVDTRLKQFFKHDMRGLKKGAHVHQENRLHFLEHSQEYFGCCGFENKNEWSEVYPAKYRESGEGENLIKARWPLSCCDPISSGIACYDPVEEYVMYKTRNSEGEDSGDGPPKYRLHRSTCFPTEEKMVTFVTYMIIVLFFLYILLSTCCLVVIAKIAHVVNSKNLVIKVKPHYVDFF